ncbi:MAG TPA: hypothetical protein VMD30_11455 [Tepidisphaeraceae bacterium]|nr:hypothetical protein [Tepidisphaeraceae bacterium]
MEAPPGFLNVQNLLLASQPRQRVGPLVYSGGMLGLLLLTAFTVGRGSDDAMTAACTTVIVSLVVGLSIIGWWGARQYRQEIGRLSQVEELVQLRRWPQAAILLQVILSSPARTQQARLQALVYLSNVLSRFHRFDDVVRIDDYLLETVRMDDMTAHVVRLSRAMALLREDRLLDADRAIMELRRGAPASNSAGLALVEIYRDVKTGHPREALEIFEKKKDLLAGQLGHRVADIFGLVARAHDMLDETDAAQAMWSKATLMTPPAEIARRYPELAPMEQKYEPTYAPPQVAGETAQGGVA